MPTFTVGSSPQEIYPGWNDDSTVYNGGAHTIFLGNDSSVSPVTGYPLVPGTSLTWRKGEKLWAVIRDIQGNLDSATIPATLVGLLNISPSAETSAKQGAARIRVGNTVVTRTIGSGAQIHLGLIETAAFGGAVWNGRLDVNAVTTPTLTGLACYIVYVNYYEPNVDGTLQFQSKDEYYIWSTANNVDNVYTISVPLDSGRGAYALVSLMGGGNSIGGFTDVFSVSVNGSFYGSFGSVPYFRHTNESYPGGWNLYNVSGAVTSDNCVTAPPINWTGTLSTTSGGMILDKRAKFVDIATFVTVAAANTAICIVSPVNSSRVMTIDTSTTGYKEARNVPLMDCISVLRGVGTFTATLGVTFHD